MIGIDPDPFRFVELALMADAKEKSEWNRASSLLAKLHNVHCTKRKDQKSPADFNPMIPKRKASLNLDVFKELLTHGKKE